MIADLSKYIGKSIFIIREKIPTKDIQTPDTSKNGQLLAQFDYQIACKY
jgi:hypothetical protein